MEDTVNSNEGKKKFAGIEIPPELKWSNFLYLYLASFCAACLVAVPSVLQPAFLKEVIKIPAEQAGTINAGLQNMSQVAWILFVWMIGAWSDKIGRRILVVLGFFTCGFSFIAFGYTKDMSVAAGIITVGGQIFVAYVIRFFVGIGIILSFPQTNTMVADYSPQKDRGKAMAYHGITMSLGSIVVYGIMAQMMKNTGVLSIFLISGAIGFLGAVFAYFGTVDRMPERKEEKTSISQLYNLISKNLAIKVSYVATIISRIDIVIISTFLILWMVYSAEKSGLTPLKATASGGLVMLVVSVATLIAWPFIGILLDRWGRAPVVISGLMATGVGFCLMAMTPNPFSPFIYFYSCLVGVGFSASTAGSTTLAADASPKAILGTILGGLQTMQPIGALFFLAASGYLFDSFGYWGPFLLKGTVNIACALWILAVRKKIEIPKEEKIAS